MKEYHEPRDNYALFGGMSLLYGVIFTFCLYKNISGITFPMYVLATIILAIYMIKKLTTAVESGKSRLKLKAGTLPYFAGMLILGIANACTTSEFFLLFNWLGMILLFVVSMIHQFYDDSRWNFIEYFKRLVILFLLSCKNVISPIIHGANYLREKENGRDKRILYVIIGLAIAFFSLCFIFPLLITSDLIFQNVVRKVFYYLSIQSIILMLLMTVMGTTLIYAFTCGLCKRNLEYVKETKLYRTDAIVGISFTSVIAGIYLLYSGIQIVYLFIGMENGLPEGVTYSQYAHSGFWQLLFVSMINFVIVLLCKNLFTESKVLNVILTIISLCTFVMIASAMYRMILYVKEYHLTFLRLLVLWFLVVLVFIMAGTILGIQH